MLNFTIKCLFAAKAFSVSLTDSGEEKSESALTLLAPIKEVVEEKIDDGSVKVVKKDAIKLEIEKPITVPDEKAQIDTVLDQIEAGFEEIKDINFDVEVETIGGKQDELKEESDEILEEADDEIAEVVEEESDIDDAEDEIDDII